MAFFNIPNATDTESILSFLSFVHHSATGGKFFVVIMFVIWAIAFITTLISGREAKRAFLFANFVGFILSVLLGLLGFLAKEFIYLFVFLLAASAFWIKLDKEGTNI